jgi:putative DNA primase/helicase
LREDLKELARGRWYGILTTLGIEAELLDGKHQACPFCGGSDRFRWTNFEDAGMFICNQCGGGSGFDLAMRYLGMDFAGVAKEIERIMGTPAKIRIPLDQNGAAADLGKAGRMAEKIWREAKALETKDNPVCRYLRSRGLGGAPGSLRFHPGIFDGDSKKKFPAMVASILDFRGAPAGIHLTFLEEVDGRWEKARIPAPKKQRRIARTIAGGAIRLTTKGGDGCLAIAEGIETAIAVREMYGTPCWSAMNSSGLASFQLPEVRPIQLHIYADNDKNYAGQKAAYTLANRLATKDDFFQVFVQAPMILGDYLDLLLGHATRRSV